MKNFGKFLMTGLAASVILASCTKDNADPVISGSSISSTTALPGDTITISATFSDTESEMDEAVLTYVYNGNAATTEETVDLSSAGGSYSYEYKFAVPAGAQEDDTYTFTLALTDKHKKDPKTVEEQFSAVTILSAGDPINSYSTKLFGAQSNATEGSYFATTTGTVYTQTAANSNSDKIDIIYAFDESTNATFVSPDNDAVASAGSTINMANGFTTKNATRYSTTTITAAEFDAMDTDADFSALASTDVRFENIAVGDVVAFVTGAGKKGLVKVTALTTGATGDITVDVKVQQ